MLQALHYPFDTDTILRKRKKLREALLSQSGLVDLRIAILGGSTTQELRSILELFLLRDGFRPAFYESEYNRYQEDVLVDDAALRAFAPQVALLHTTWQNVTELPALGASEAELERAVDATVQRFSAIWEKLGNELGCQVIQNNFDLPGERSLGNMDSWASAGASHLLMRLNLELARYARASRTLVINDIHHLSARMGLERWHDRDYWYGYKMAMSHEATVLMSANVATLVRALLGRSRKCLVLDLDNTLWGGVIGDDGLTGIKLGRDTPQGSAYLDFQRFCLELKRRGVVLAVCSKNEPEIAKQAFSHPDMLLQLSDIAVFKAGWGPKHEAIREIAAELNLGLDALVFVDDNPAERELVAAQLPQVAVPNVGDQVSRFAQHLDRAGYFEAARLSGDDLQRAEQYSANAARAAAASTFANYGEYLQSLTMKAVIAPVDATYLDRVVQLTNKTNQFNLTTKRFTAAEMQAAVSDPRFVTLYGRLIDKFGDNGLVSVVQGEARGDELHLPLWLMSCRVLKRDMELAMLDALAADALRRGLKALVGYYLPTAKNAMVAEHYGALGFERVSADDAGRSTWRLDLSHGYKPRNQHIEITHDG